MLKDEIVQLNPWWEKGYKKEPIIPRPYYLDKILNSQTNQIQIIIGARRVGKTYIMKDAINKLLDTEEPKDILYITAELPNMVGRELVDLLEAYKQIHGRSDNPMHVFLDEVQDLANWQTQIKYLHDNYKIKLYLSGSSGLVLTKETNKLTGRFLLTHVYPMSYKELKSFDNKFSLEDYLDTGGYPEYVLTGQKEVLLNTVEGILYRDLLSYYGIRNPTLLKDLLQLLCDKVTTTVSDKTLAQDLHVDIKTAQFYIKYLQDVFLVYPLYRFGKSHKKVKGFSPKYYLNDTGLLKLFSKTPREGHLAENAVFLHVKQLAERKLTDLHFDFLADTGGEVDFAFEDKLYDVKAGALPTDFSEQVTYIVKDLDPNNPARQVGLEKFLLT